MGSEDTSMLHQQYQIPSQSSDVDFEAAEQLLQHSRSGRESNGDSMAGSASKPEASTDFGGTSRNPGLENGLLENGNENEESELQEPHADSHYAPITNEPSLGQVCRYALSHAFQRSKGYSW